MNLARTRTIVFFLIAFALIGSVCCDLSGCKENDDQGIRAVMDNRLNINDEDLAHITATLNDDITLDAYHVKLGDFVGTLLQGYSYNIDSIARKGDTATVQATITARDFSKSIDAFDHDLSDNEKTIAKLKKKGKEDQLESTVSDMLRNELDQAGSSTTSATITVDLFKGAEGWQLSDPSGFEEDWYDAMFGTTLKRLGVAVADK